MVIDIENENDEGIDNKEENAENKGGNTTSIVWDHFKRIKGCKPGSEKSKCNHCGIVFNSNNRKNGTGSMKTHLFKSCRKSPLRDNRDRKQKILQFEALSKVEREKVEDTHNIRNHTFNQERLRKKIALMCIKDNQPFRVVENEGFVELLNEAEPRFKMPSRWTIARDCLKIYKVEVLKLKELFVSQRISLTTDTWTSGQNINYMCLTAHWINDEWKLCKKIINFCQIGSHKGAEIGKMILALLRKWDIDQVFTITVDNASSNDLAIGHLKMFLRGRDAILGNKYMHLRCCAHILNLIVKDGLKEQHDSIARIRNAVRYVRSSPARLTKFRTCVEREKIICEKMVCLDVDTRWNSTYLMLEVAMVYEGAFERMIIEDANYENYFKNDDNEGLWDNGKKKKKKVVKGHPNRADFSTVKCFIHFLKLFYDVTMKISGSKYCTSNIFFIVCFNSFGSKV